MYMHITAHISIEKFVLSTSLRGIDIDQLIPGCFNLLQVPDFTDDSYNSYSTASSEIILMIDHCTYKPATCMESSLAFGCWKQVKSALASLIVLLNSFYTYNWFTWSFTIQNMLRSNWQFVQTSSLAFALTWYVNQLWHRSSMNESLSLFNSQR